MAVVPVGWLQHAFIKRGIEQQAPLACWQADRLLMVGGIEHKQQGVAIAGVLNAEQTAGPLRIVPVVALFQFPAGQIPLHLMFITMPLVLLVQQRQLLQTGVALTQCHQLLHKLQKILLLTVQLPVQPADVVVLTIGIVVAPLAMAELVPAKPMDHALAKQ